jgi:hypothetical protein
MVREAMRTLHDRVEQCRQDGGKHLRNMLLQEVKYVTVMM